MEKNIKFNQNASNCYKSENNEILRTTEICKCLSSFSEYWLRTTKKCPRCLKEDKLEKENKELSVKVQKLESENKTLQEQADEDIRDILDKSQEWHQRVEDDLKAKIIELKEKLKLEILEEDQLKEDEVECLTEQLFIS